MIGLPRRTGVVVGSLLVAAAPAAAHEGHADHGSLGLVDLLPAVVFVLSVVVVSTAVYLDHRGGLDERWADVGVVVGSLGALASLALLV